VAGAVGQGFLIKVRLANQRDFISARDEKGGKATWFEGKEISLEALPSTRQRKELEIRKASIERPTSLVPYRILTLSQGTFASQPGIFVGEEDSSRTRDNLTYELISE